jgi:hypothetical protein
VHDIPATDPQVPEFIQIPNIAMRHVSVPIRGLGPLVVHAWSEKSIRQMLEKQTSAARMKKPPKDPVADFEAAKYKDENGKDCLKPCFFKNAIVSAARFVDGVTMTAMKMSFFVKGDEHDNLPLKFAKCEMHRAMVRNESGVADIRFRPMYHDWRTEITIHYFANELTLSQVILLVRQAGLRVGLCEGRPEKSSLNWGRFDVDMAALKGAKITSESVAA